MIFAGDALGADSGNGWRPHRLDDDFARRHQVDAFVERLPEGAELACLLGLDQEIDGRIDLGLGHVALVGIFDVAHGFHDHRGIHDADRRDVRDRRLALELRVHDIGPGRDFTADQIRTNAERIGIVDRRHHGEPLGLFLGEFLVARLFDEADRMRRRALGDHAVRLQLAVLEQRHDLVVIFQLLHIHRLDDAGRIDLLEDPVFDVGNVVGVRLRDGALGSCIRVGCGHLERDAEIRLALFGNRIEVRNAGTELADRDRVLRPDGREAGNGPRTGSKTGSGRCGLEQRAARKSLRGLLNFSHSHVLL